MPQRRTVTSRSHEPRWRYAEEVRRLREQSGLTLRQLAERLGWDWSTLGKLERGQSLGSPEMAQALDEHYGTPGLLLALWELAVGDPTQFKEQYRRYMLLEAGAVSLWHFAVSILPGLLQSDGYAREVLATGGIKGEELTQQVEARVGRRALLVGEDAPTFRTILSEAVLRTPLRDAGAWREQLEHLVEVAERPQVTLQVLPLGAGLHGLVSTDVMFLRLPDGRTVAYTETAYHGELIEENREVERLQRAYDSMRDLALSPAESLKFIGQMLEEAPCDPST
ncbi:MULTISPECIES: helix-turn-helix transcriptional regulator [unclassified Streptomyces]|uniref:helix-turn-helix domain-containing protein n=1 Tax=unclassified Streptomyces TaxID=2593676 RepID=UPI002365465E|nr:MULTISPECIES: helix-turn-helix transcriptional regulator [unclassified Streptomyces]MDF3148286.1 helix-turn-helix transcriptional regulator [Streptomyces sp. T21Q-yed]WDF38625.1 helix-turn-helix transcriptional regulator [Streptomyces sp. T12]